MPATVTLRISLSICLVYVLTLKGVKNIFLFFVTKEKKTSIYLFLYAFSLDAFECENKIKHTLLSLSIFARKKNLK